MQINPHQHLSAYKSALIDKGLSEFDADLAIKALPSAPVWTTTTIEYGFWDANREKLLALMATYQKNERVHGCIDIIAKAVANAACQLMEVVDSSDKSLLGRRHCKLITGKRLKRLRKQWAVPQLARRALNDDDGLAEITEHPMLTALSSTDNDQTFHSLLRLMVVNLIVFGVSFFKKERDPRGEVSSYLYLPAYNVTPDRGTDGRIEGWFYSSTYGEAIPKLPIAKDDMLIVRWPSLTDPHAGGDSPLQAALRQVDLFGKMLDWQDWTFGNRARMDGVFVPKVSDGTSISPEEASRQEKRINDKLRGPGNGRWIVSEFAGQYVPTSWAPTDLATLEVEDKVATAVMFALNVPEAFANNDGNRANLEGSLEQFARFCVAPVIALIESSFNAELKSEFETTNAIWVFENVIPEDDNFALEEEKVKVQAWQVARQNGDVTANEYRMNVLGIDEDPELDEEDEAPSPPPSTVMPVSGISAVARDGTLGKSFDLIALNRLVSAGRIDRATAICMASFGLSIPEQDAKRLVCHSAKKKRRRTRRPDLPPLILPDPIDLEDALKQQMAQQQSHYLNQCDGLGKRLLQELHGRRLEDGPGGTGDFVDDTADLPERFEADADWNPLDAMAYEPPLQAAAKRTIDDRIRALIDAGADESAFANVARDMDAVVAEASAELPRIVNATTSKRLNAALAKLRQELLDGTVQDDPASLLRQRVEEIFENIEAERAATIAGTEASRASHQAQRAVAKASGRVRGFRFEAFPDCCQRCAELDGKAIELEGDEECMPPIHPNCRCRLIEVVHQRYGVPVPRSASVVDFATKDTEIGAQLYGDARLARLAVYLGRRSVCLEVGSPDLPAEKAGAFIANPDGTARLLLKAAPTNELVWHELGHYIQWSDIGSDAYLALPREFGNNVPEQFVFNLFDQPGRWSRLTPGYRLHMVDYITNTWGGIGR